MSDRFATHNVTNQVPPLTDVNLFASDTALNDAVTREGAAASARTLNAFGLTAGSQESRELAILANRHPPELEHARPLWPPPRRRHLPSRLP